MIRWGALAAVSLCGCSTLLGGLEEGAPRVVDAVDAGVDAVDAGVDASSSCGSWLAGFRYRRPIDVENTNETALVGFSLRQALDLATPIRDGKMQADARDLRVTRGDGVTVVPHSIEGRADREAAIVWSKVDLAVGQNRLYVYYGATSPPAPLTESVFVDGVLGNGTFAEGTSPWIASRGPGAEQGTHLAIDGERAAVAIDPASAERAIGWCQVLTLPNAGRYQLVFDVSVTRSTSTRSHMVVWTGGIGGTAIWEEVPVTGSERGHTTRAIDPGRTVLCIGAIAAPSDGLAGAYDNLVLRRFAPNEPLADVPRDEQRCAQP